MCVLVTAYLRKILENNVDQNFLKENALEGLDDSDDPCFIISDKPLQGLTNITQASVQNMFHKKTENVHSSSITLKPKIEQELDRLVKNKVLVPTEFSKWATPIVPILKKNGGIRICGDFKVTLNSQLEFQQFPLPRIEYLFSQLEGGMKFSKIDLSEAYQQILLDDQSKELVTISTHKGLFSYQRLPFGIHCAPSIFQIIMEQLFNIPGVISFLDDILVTGRNDLEHLERLQQVFQKLSECGFQLKKEKCSFMQESLTYMGHLIDRFGLHKTDERVEAVVKTRVPSNITELKSFLGGVNYYVKFLPNASSILYPLYSSLKKKHPLGMDTGLPK
ncbi:uncharacterized protein K02A2.6-like [Cylas formicarius]|uniref:uncharacterized protein K02A2.6-like n=1 Tax=Cylas formicarius TaxID=197179 RepID=UPI0029584193|nr:uncharacterized protein K02A2.6-like [Cylas formicarius]